MSGLEKNITPSEIYDIPCRHPAPVNPFCNMYISSPSTYYPVFDVVFQEMKYGSYKKIIERREDKGISSVFHYRIIRYKRTVILTLVFGNIFLFYPVVTLPYSHCSGSFSGDHSGEFSRLSSSSDGLSYTGNGYSITSEEDSDSFIVDTEGKSAS